MPAQTPAIPDFPNDNPSNPERSVHARSHHYLTADIPGIGGTIKQRPEDFLVEELPQYDPCGEGEHFYLLVEKTNLSTFEMIDLVAAHFGVPRQAVGYAGLKDKAAITRQVVSVHVPGKRIEDFPMLTHERLGVLWADYHTNKLRPGHLRGNRFSIRVRDTHATNALRAHRVLGILESKGVPNRFGEQRFGVNGVNHLIGRALIRFQFEEAIALLLGPNPRDPERTTASRRAFAAGDLRTALIENPRHARNEERALRALIRGRSPREAVLSTDESLRKFFLSAFQSAVFNAVLDDRLHAGTFAELCPGDLAFKHDNRAVFAADEAVIAAPETAARLSKIEISPSGPLWSATMLRAASDIDAREIAAIEHFGITLDELTTFAAKTRGMLEGARRPLRVPVIDPAVEGGVDEHGPYVRCAFELPRGSFATVVLREIMKPADGTLPDEDSGGAG